jgi:hypothetical protein
MSSVVIFCFDPRWPGSFVPYRSNRTIRHFTVQRTDSIPMIVQRIRSVAGNDQIDTLYLCAHGNSGYLQLGTGLTPTTAPSFSVLSGRFASMGFIQIHGCGVASSTSITAPGGTVEHPLVVPGTFTGSGLGLELLRTLANHTGALVEAAINAQYDDPLYTYEGPTVVVGRGGSFASSQ